MRPPETRWTRWTCLPISALSACAYRSIGETRPTRQPSKQIAKLGPLIYEPEAKRNARAAVAQGRKAAFQSKPRKTSATPGSEERDINAAIVPDVKELNVHQAATQLALAIGGLIEEADYEYLTPRIEAVLGWTDELNRSDFRNIDRELSLLVGRAEELITQAEEWRTRFNEADHHVERDDDDVLEPEPVPSDPAHSELTAA